RGGGLRAAGLFPRGPRRARPGEGGHRRDEVPARGLVGAPTDSGRNDDRLLHAREADRPPGGSPRGRSGEREPPRRGHRPVPSGDRRERDPVRLWRRPGSKAMAAGPREGARGGRNEGAPPIARARRVDGRRRATARPPIEIAALEAASALVKDKTP